MMKPLQISLALCFVSFGLLAQTPEAGKRYTLPPAPEVDETAPLKQTLKKKSGSAASSDSLLWSEDFAQGIPSTWVNQGYGVDLGTGTLIPNANAVWEYRGPNTTPSNSRGSRGAFSGSGNPIASRTTGNGFIIFDSDWLDSQGDRNSQGQGPAPVPHIGTLTTDTMDLSGFPDVQITFQSYAREFFADLLLAVSNDGGVTYQDTLAFHDLPTNSSSDNPTEIAANISDVAGGEALVVLQFIFDGRPGNSNGNGYYYWQLDDIEVRQIPDHSFQFVQSGTAPAHDVIYPADQPRYGNIQIDQAMPITFDSNIYNFGVQDQNNVRLVVTIEDAGGNVVSTLTSPTHPSIATNDTVDFSVFTTTSSWTPGAIGDYNVIFTVESDSIPSVAPSPADTMPINANEFIHASHFGSWDNSVGTTSGVNGLQAIGQVITFPNPNKDTSNYVFLNGIHVPFSSGNDVTGTLIIEVYDSTGFTYGSTGGPAGSPFITRVFMYDTAMHGTTQFFTFRSPDPDNPSDSIPLALPSDAGYMVLMYMLPDVTGGEIRIGNDQTFRQATGLLAMLSGTNTWFTGFSSSRTISNLMWEIEVAETPGEEDDTSGVALKSWKLQNLLRVYPNPAEGVVSIEINEGGDYELEVLDLSGKTVHFEDVSANSTETLKRDFSHLPKGTYLVRLSNETVTSTRRLSLR